MRKGVSSEALIDTGDVNIPKKMPPKTRETGSGGSGMFQAQGRV